MIIEQEKFFKGLGFSEYTFEYEFGTRKAYKGDDGSYYRIDHFANSYVIESAESEDEAKLNQFEDDDTFADNMEDEDIINLVQTTLNKYVKIK